MIYLDHEVQKVPRIGINRKRPAFLPFIYDDLAPAPKLAHSSLSRGPLGGLASGASQDGVDIALALNERGAEF
jgi:hypothetical protein